MKSLADIPHTRPVNNTRSPLRKPRYKRQVRVAQAVARKEAFVDFLMAGETPQEAADRLQTDINTFRQWARLDAEFKEACRIAIEDRRLLAQGKLSGSLDRAVDVVVNGLEAKSEKVRIDDAHRILKGMGVTQDRTETETEIKGVIGLFNADDIAREFREARKRILEAGGGPVGVPDHPS